MRRPLPLIKVVLLIGVTTMLTSCGSSDKKMEDLQAQVKALQTENDSLKARLQLLTQTSVAVNPMMQTVPLVPVKPSTTDPTVPVQPEATATMTITTPAEPPAAETIKQFSDLNAEVPNADFIGDLRKLHLFDDLGDKFEPYKPVTRGEYCTWLFKANNTMVPIWWIAYHCFQERPRPYVAKSFTNS